MQPKYEIFASMLTGTWMPWLENNRQQERFGHLLQSVNDSNGHACSAAFKMLVLQSGSLLSPAMQRFRKEACHLAKVCTHAADKGGTAFFNLSANTPRQQFYNRLTGYSFNGYDRWATGFLSDLHGTEVCDWYRMRMADTLRNLLKCVVPCHHAEQVEQLIAWRVRAALCVLLHRLTTAGSDEAAATDPSFNIRNALLATPASVCEEITGLFDALTGEKKSPAPAPAVHVPAQTAAQQIPAASPAAEHDFIAMAREMNLNIDAMRQAVGLLVNAGPPKEKQQDLKPEQYIDGARVRELLGTSTSSLQRFRDSGKLPFTKIGSKYCYSLKDVTKLIEKGKNEKINSTGNLKPGKPKY